MSSLVRNVPLFTSLEVSPFLLCCCRWGLRRSAALRRGLSGAFRVKRRRRPQRVLTFAFDLVTAAFFFPHGLPATDGSGRACFFVAGQARAAAWPLLPRPRSAATPDLRTRCVYFYSPPQLLHPPTHRSMPCSVSVRTAGSAA